MFFLKLASPELAIARVRQRAREGGPNIPEPVIRRRFASGLGNFENLYKTLVDEWALYDNCANCSRPPHLQNTDLAILAGRTRG